MSARLIALPLPATPSCLRQLERIWDAGDAVLPLAPRLSRSESSRLLDRMKPHALLEDSQETALPHPAPVQEGTALVIATSGTTGPPKGVVLGHEAIEAAVRLTNSRLGAEAGQRWLCCLPLDHIAGLMTLLRSRALGGEAIVHPRFDVDAIASASEAAFVSVVPTMLQRLLDAGVDLRRFAKVLVGGGPVPPELIERARDRGARTIVTYGMTETTGGVVYDGTPLPSVHVELDQEGRISLASPTLMNSYRLDADATQRALIGGRFVTQDRGRWDGDGRLRVLERLDRTIITGGKNVSLVEVEEALRCHPGVIDASVEGEPDPVWGQRLIATVVPRDATQPPTSEELTLFLRDRLSQFKVPRLIRVGDGA